MNNVKLYIPIENLSVESKVTLGKVTVFPSKYVQTIIKRLNKITGKTKNTQEQKIRWIKYQKDELSQHLGRYAFIEITRHINKKEDLIPKDLTSIYDQVKEVLAVLYLLQKQIAGIFSIETQKFGLRNELNRSLNFLVAIQGDERSSYNLRREGVLADWTFVNRETRKFGKNPIYNFFHQLLKKDIKSEIENRLLSSIIWLYDAAMDFSPTNRFTKIAISLEVLFASGRRQKSFRLSRFSALLSHLYIFSDIKCLCPILESHSTREYVRKTQELKLPGVCSAFWNMHKWYGIRSDIVHDAQRAVSKKSLGSFEWWAHKLIVAVIEIVAKEKISSLDELERFLEDEYRAKITS